MGYKTVLVEQRGKVAKVIMNRPDKKNAMNPQLVMDMAQVLEDLRYDDSVAVVVLTGAGNSFCAGMDLKEFFYDLKGKKPKEYDRIYRLLQEWRGRTLRFFPKPTIAMINGYCFGGAFPNVECCDLAIAADEAQFGLSEINFGLFPGGHVSKTLANLFRPRDALLYGMTGRRFDGKKAAEIGFVNYSVPLARLEDEVMELANEIAGKDPAALKATKDAYRFSLDMGWEAAMNYSAAKENELYLVQKGAWVESGIGDFMKGLYKPGMGGHEAIKKKAKRGAPSRLRRGVRLQRRTEHPARQPAQDDGPDATPGSVRRLDRDQADPWAGERAVRCRSRGIRRSWRQCPRHGRAGRRDRAQELRLFHRLRRQRVLRPQRRAQGLAGAEELLVAEAAVRRDQDVDLDVRARCGLRPRLDANRARRDGDEWIINGRKIWATGAGAKNNVINVYVKTDPAVDYRKGMSLILVPNDTPGLEMRKLDMLGRRCVGTYELTFDNVRVPASHLVGGENNGWACVLSGLQIERITPPPAIAAGLKRRLSWRFSYAKDRQQFGRSIGTFQAIAHMLADMQTELEAARTLSGAPHGWSATTRPMRFG